MFFFYDMRDVCDHPEYEFWTEEQVRKIRLYPLNKPDAWAEEATARMEKEDGLSLWCVHENCGDDTIPVDCKDTDEAYENLMWALNKSVYEYVNDI